MKVALFMITELEYVGGMEQYFIDTARELKIRNQDLEIDIITMDEAFSKKIARLLNFYYMKPSSSPGRNRRSSENLHTNLTGTSYIKCHTMAELRSLLEKYDVIYSKNEVLEACVLKLRLGYQHLPPIIFGCHTTLSYMGPQSLHGRIHNLLYGSWPYRFLASGVRAFHVINPADLKLASKLFPKREVFYIANPFDYETFRNKAERQKRTTRQEGVTKILWVGRLTAQKGVDRLISLIDRINTTGVANQVEWVIVGTGEEINSLEELASKWRNVKIVGHVEHEAMPKIYAEANLFISTSRWEGLPYNLLEAMACRLTCIAFEIPGPKEIIIDGKNGYLAKDMNSFHDLLMDTIKGKVPKKHDDASLKRYEPMIIYRDLFNMLTKLKLVRK